MSRLNKQLNRTIKHCKQGYAKVLLLDNFMSEYPILFLQKRYRLTGSIENHPWQDQYVTTTPGKYYLITHHLRDTFKAAMSNANEVVKCHVRRIHTINISRILKCLRIDCRKNHFKPIKQITAKKHSVLGETELESEWIKQNSDMPNRICWLFCQTLRRWLHDVIVWNGGFHMGFSAYHINSASINSTFELQTNHFYC